MFIFTMGNLPAEFTTNSEHHVYIHYGKLTCRVHYNNSEHHVYIHYGKLTCRVHYQFRTPCLYSLWETYLQSSLPIPNTMFIFTMGNLPAEFTTNSEHHVYIHYGKLTCRVHYQFRTPCLYSLWETYLQSSLPIPNTMFIFTMGNLPAEFTTNSEHHVYIHYGKLTCRVHYQFRTPCLYSLWETYLQSSLPIPNTMFIFTMGNLPAGVHYQFRTPCLYSLWETYLQSSLPIPNTMFIFTMGNLPAEFTTNSEHHVYIHYGKLTCRVHYQFRTPCLYSLWETYLQSSLPIPNTMFIFTMGNLPAEFTTNSEHHVYIHYGKLTCRVHYQFRTPCLYSLWETYLQSSLPIPNTMFIFTMGNLPAEFTTNSEHHVSDIHYGKLTCRVHYQFRTPCLYSLWETYLQSSLPIPNTMFIFTMGNLPAEFTTNSEHHVYIHYGKLTCRVHYQFRTPCLYSLWETYLQSSLPIPNTMFIFTMGNLPAEFTTNSEHHVYIHYGKLTCRVHYQFRTPCLYSLWETYLQSSLPIPNTMFIFTMGNLPAEFTTNSEHHVYIHYGKLTCRVHYQFRTPCLYSLWETYLQSSLPIPNTMFIFTMGNLPAEFTTNSEHHVYIHYGKLTCRVHYQFRTPCLYSLWETYLQSSLPIPNTMFIFTMGNLPAEFTTNSEHHVYIHYGKLTCRVHYQFRTPCLYSLWETYLQSSLPIPNTMFIFTMGNLPAEFTTNSEHHVYIHYGKLTCRVHYQFRTPCLYSLWETYLQSSLPIPNTMFIFTMGNLPAEFTTNSEHHVYIHYGKLTCRVHYQFRTPCLYSLWETYLQSSLPIPNTMFIFTMGNLPAEFTTNSEHHVYIHYGKLTCRVHYQFRTPCLYSLWETYLQSSLPIPNTMFIFTMGNLPAEFTTNSEHHVYIHYGKLTCRVHYQFRTPCLYSLWETYLQSSLPIPNTMFIFTMGNLPAEFTTNSEHHVYIHYGKLTCRVHYQFRTPCLYSLWETYLQSSLPIPNTMFIFTMGNLPAEFTTNSEHHVYIHYGKLTCRVHYQFRTPCLYSLWETYLQSFTTNSEHHVYIHYGKLTCRVHYQFRTPCLYSLWETYLQSSLPIPNTMFIFTMGNLPAEFTTNSEHHVYIHYGKLTCRVHYQFRTPCLYSLWETYLQSSLPIPNTMFIFTMGNLPAEFTTNSDG